MPCKQQKAAGRDAGPDAPGDPLETAGSIAGVYVESSKRIMSFYEATREHLLSLDVALSLLEAQAATGSISDPLRSRRVPVAEAVRTGLVGLELKERLLSADRAATGFLDPYTEEKISLYQAIQKELVGREQGIRLLQAQVATGGVIDPATGGRLPAGVACERGYLDEEMSQLASDPGHEDGKVFLDPSTMEQVTYSELRKRCVVDPASGFLLLPLQITFPGLRGRVTADQLLSSEIINKDLFKKLKEGETSAKEVVSMDTVRKYLQGTGSIGGLLLPDSQEKISIYQAKRKGLLRPGTSLILLEAQAATGFVIDPAANKRYSVDEALRANVIGPDVYDKLLAAEKSVTGYRDPYSGGKISLFQAMQKELIVRDHGIRLLEAQIATGGIIDPINSHRIPVEVAYKRGYFDKKMNLILSDPSDDTKGFFDPNTHENLTYLQLKEKCITEPSTGLCLLPLNSRKRQFFAFKGLRKRVSASDLFQSQLIDKKTLDELNQGKKTVKEVTEMESVRRYLEGSNFIAGVLIQPSNEKMSIYQAMWKGILRPGTALVLLEAQAATGYIIDPEKNKKFSVEEALEVGLIGAEIFEKLLCAERAVTGYTDPYTKAPMSLFEAMNQGLIVKSHGIRLLEAQIATGGIIDPVHSHRVPVEVAYKRGYFNQEMNQILSDPSDDTKGFFDPNTHENLTYMQLLERCVQDPDTGLYMLQVVKEGGKYFYIDESTKQALRSKHLQVKVGKFKDQTVSVWEVLCSHYISEQKRKELVMQYKSKNLALEELISLILKIIEDTERRGEALKVKGLRGEVSVSELFNSEIIDKKTLDQLQDGSLPLASLTKRDTIQRYLDGTGCIAGVLLPLRKEVMSIYQALKKGLLTEQCALGLLEAQAATGFLLDPQNHQKLSVDEAVSSGLVGSELHEQLLSAEKAVTGYTDPQTGSKISLFQALRQKIIVRDHGIRLLEAQLATGGIIDPWHGHRLPLEVAYKRGHLDEDMFLLLSDPDHGIKGFIDPNTHEKISYSQLLQRCAEDRESGLYLLQVLEKEGDYFYIDEQTKNALLCTKVQVPVGKYKGQVLSLWELLCSEYITEEKRKELVKKYKAESQHIVQGIIETILKIIREKEEDRSDVWFQGIRQQITASELLSAQIITEETIEKLQEGKETAQEIAKMDSVRRYLEGTGSIAGVLVPSKAEPGKMEKMSIYQAMWKGILRQGTALVLLEAQAATGFIVDPVKNQKLSVDEAVSSGLVGSELKNKLLSAERAVTGYTHPYTGQKISLFQAMKQDLIVRDHGIRLLEAQIATGGIIDPVHSHRVPVEVAYKRGYFDQEMNQILSDPGDDTKGFFDPNTHENLTYLQLLRRCVPDPDTGLLMLQLMDKGSRSSSVKFTGLRKQVSASDLLDSGIIDTGTLADLVQGSKTVQEVTQMASVKRYLDGTGVIAGVLVPSKAEPGKLEKMSIYQAMWKGILMQGTALVLLEAQAATGFLVDPVKNQKLSVDEAVSSGLVGSELHEKLLSAERAVTGYSDPYTGDKISLFQAMKKELIVRDHGIRLLEAQIATGGIIDPVHSHRVPVEVAYKRGYFDQEMSQILSDPGDDTKGFFDPNTHENLTYLQLLRRCVPDPDTGLLMLQLMDKGSVLYQLSEDARKALRAARTTLAVGLFQGQSVTVWELLFSRYIPEHRRQDLLRQYKAGTVTIAQMIDILVDIITRAEAQGLGANGVPKATEIERSSSVKFTGLRKQVSASDLLDSGIIDTGTLADLVQGSKTVQEVTQMASVKRYLDGTGIIAGVLVPSKAEPGKLEKMSIYQAMWKGILMQGTALVLLEAQAATGFLVDPVKNQKLSVDEAVSSGLVGSELHEKLLSAERAVTGYSDPYTGDKISLFQAMKKELIVRDHGIRLLEAQIATGGIIDPVHSHRVPVEVAYKRGYFDQEMNQILSDPGDDTKGFFDPNTHENLTYLQLLRRCVPDPDTGLLMLQLMDKGSVLYQLSEDARKALRAARTTLAVGLFQGQSVTVWELLFSRYIPEHRRQDLLRQYKVGTVTIAQMIDILVDIITRAEAQGLGANGVPKATEIERSSSVKFTGLRKQVSASDLLDSGIIDTGTLADLVQGSKTVQEVTQMASVKRYLDGTGVIAGVLVPSKAEPGKLEKMSIYQAMWKGILMQGTALVLLEAQAATGFLVDPVKNQKLSVDEAVSSGLVGSELHEKLLSAERAVTGYSDPYTGDKISLFQAMKKELIVRDHGIRLLEAQIATGGIIDPVHSHRVPVEVAYKRGYFDQEMNQILSDPGDDTKGFFDPNTHENLTYLQLLRRCVPDPDTGLLMLQLMDKGSVLYQLSEDARKALRAARTTLANSSASNNQKEQEQKKEREREQELERSLKSHTVEVSAGGFHGRKVSLWELLFSKFVSEAKRQELLGRLRAGSLALAELAMLLTLLVEEAAQRSSSVKFTGLRKQVSASDLLDSGIIDTGTLADLVQGSKTVQEVTQMASVKRYLDGTGVIAGVLVPSKAEPGKLEKMSIYQAMWKGILMQGTALVLLEAQAATGFLVDPVKNQKLSVDEAVSSGLVGSELHEKLLSAERAVTGYSDPYTGDKISLFQAMKKELIVRDHGIRLLEAQIATGGIIDPVHSHRVPVEVAYKRGYFDQEMSRILSDPENQTRTCFDPNTHENLTYLQLLRRCVPDPDTGLLMLQLMDKGSVLYQLSEDARKALRAARTTLAVGLFQGQSVTVWELLFSRYIPEHQREELLRKYKGGAVTIAEMIDVLTATITGAERDNGALGSSTAKPNNKARASPPAQDTQVQEQQLRKSLKSATVRVAAGEFRGQNVSVLDLLFSSYVPQDKRQELLELYRAGILTTEQVGAVVTTIVNRTEAANAARLAKARGPHRAVPATGEDGEDCSARLDEALRSATITVPAGELQGQQVSLWDLIFSNYIPEEKRQELLELYRERLLTLEQMTTVVSTLIKKNESAGRKLHISVKSSSKDPVTAAGEEGDNAPKEETWKTTLKTTMVHVEAGEFQGREVSLWDLLHSHYIPEENRKELLELYEAGELSLEQVRTVVTTIVTRTAAAEPAEPAAPVNGPRAEPVATEAEPTHLDRDEGWEETLKATRAEPVATEAEPTHLDRDEGWEETLKATRAEVSVGEFQGRQTSLWDLLFSDYIPEEKRQELLELYRGGTLPIQELLSTTSSLASDSLEQHFRTLPEHTMDLLRSEGSYITFDPSQERRVSVWELLSSKRVSEYKREACLDTYPSGGLTVNRITITTTITTGPRLEKSHPRHH
ncbi:unnamed protein product [Coccothraustes coccothraustes]